MDIEKFTDKARESIGEAQSIAAGMGHQEVDTGHLALALVRQDKGIVPNILQRPCAGFRCCPGRDAA